MVGHRPKNFKNDFVNEQSLELSYSVLLIIIVCFYAVDVKNFSNWGKMWDLSQNIRYPGKTPRPHRSTVANCLDSDLFLIM
jgi:hypothetical protein